MSQTEAPGGARGREARVMDAFPMFARCALAQWNGYNLGERMQITADWALGHSVYYPSLGHKLHVIWAVQHDPPTAPSAADHLISIKIDSWPLEFEPEMK
ncbi:MAG: hypothetical protein ACREIQ_03040 [Nitrospiria bacterium]